MNYKYWNDFVDEWKKLPASVYSDLTFLNPCTYIGGWENPNREVPLMNSIKSNDYSIHYLPEPWWGNEGNSPLNSVVINYNPGWAESYKHITIPEIQNLHKYPDYAAFVGSQVAGVNDHFPRTNNWHWKERAKIVFDTCQRIGVHLNGNNQLLNHLSIELIPWHTTNVGNILQYINRNLKLVYNKSLVFAADQSRRIVNLKLRKKVIVRSGGNTTLNLLDKIQRSGIAKYKIIIPPAYTPYSPGTTTGNGGYFKFILSSHSDVEFISIWGRTSRNKFPSDPDMDWIFANVI